MRWCAGRSPQARALGDRPAPAQATSVPPRRFASNVMSRRSTEPASVRHSTGSALSTDAAGADQMILVKGNRCAGDRFTSAHWQPSWRSLRRSGYSREGRRSGRIPIPSPPRLRRAGAGPDPRQRSLRAGTRLAGAERRGPPAGRPRDDRTRNARGNPVRDRDAPLGRRPARRLRDRDRDDAAARQPRSAESHGGGLAHAGPAGLGRAGRHRQRDDVGELARVQRALAACVRGGAAFASSDPPDAQPVGNFDDRDRGISAGNFGAILVCGRARRRVSPLGKSSHAEKTSASAALPTVVTHPIQVV